MKFFSFFLLGSSCQKVIDELRRLHIKTYGSIRMTVDLNNREEKRKKKTKNQSHQTCIPIFTAIQNKNQSIDFFPLAQSVSLYYRVKINNTAALEENSFLLSKWNSSILLSLVEFFFSSKIINSCLI